MQTQQVIELFIQLTGQIFILDVLGLNADLQVIASFQPVNLNQIIIPHFGMAQQQPLYLPGAEIDSHHFEHIVGSADYPVDPQRRAATATRLTANNAGYIASAETNQWQRLAG
jgi:hypothetical protein